MCADRRSDDSLHPIPHIGGDGIEISRRKKTQRVLGVKWAREN